MITHPRRDVLLAHVDGELPERDEHEVGGHVAACALCRATASELRSNAVLFVGALHVLDASEPTRWSSAGRGGRDVIADDVAVLPMRAARMRAVSPLSPAMRVTRESLSSVPGRASRGRDALRWAAGILLVASAATSAALIGTRIIPGTSDRGPAAAPPVAAERSVVAVIVTPFDGSLLVALTGAGAGSRVRVILADRVSANVVVEGVDSPRFTAVTGRVDVDLRGDIAEVSLELPRDVREAVVTLGGATLVAVRDGVVTPPAAATEGIPLDGAPGPRME